MHDKGKGAGPRSRLLTASKCGENLMDGRLRDKAAAERFGRNLWRARRRAGLSLELGSLTSLHRTHIGFMERGERLPRVDTLIKLTSVLALEAGELLEGIEWIVPGRDRPGSFSIDPRAEADGHAG